MVFENSLQIEVRGLDFSGSALGPVAGSYEHEEFNQLNNH
jgi:hypothetical protein